MTVGSEAVLLVVLESPAVLTVAVLVRLAAAVGETSTETVMGAVVLVGVVEASMLRTWMWWGLALVAAWPCLVRCDQGRLQGSNE